MIKWTDDCCGKKDYDGELVSVSTRYWPRGGGFFIVEEVNGNLIRFDGDETRPGIKPSAASSILFRMLYTEDDSLEIARKDFKGETFDDVRTQVEEWVREQVAKVRAALEVAFGRQHDAPKPEAGGEGA